MYIIIFIIVNIFPLKFIVSFNLFKIDNKGKLGNWLFCFQLFAVEYQGLSQKP